ncbi:hypothetical protein K2F45_20675 [Sphingobacterium siyangense]|uniref:DUF7674 family protein n=1 Tax=Sphingobacterium siyangense TaxID=459529 RepID=UPI00200CD714|nr:hypothetical protein [Sphingobacterium siyangense]UQA74202.1 hypothetical protein K2F45_20675 [Sphingobacterium siyangense]
MMKDQDLFIKELIQLFPSLKEEFLDEDYRDSITFQMGSFKRFIQQAIAKNDGDKFDAMVVFLNKNLPLVDKRVQNAVYLSFLGKLDFSKNPDFKKRLGQHLGEAYTDIENYNNSPRNNRGIK